MSEVNEKESSPDAECLERLNSREAPLKCKGPPWWRSCRYLLALIQFWGFAILFSHRNHFNIALVCMVNHTAVDIQYNAFIHMHKSNGDIAGNNESDIVESINSSSAVSTSSSCGDVAEQVKEDGPYVWSRDVQGALLGAMHWTYMSMQFPGAVFAYRFLTVKATTIGAIATVCLVHLLTPVLADLSPWAVLVARLVVGVCVALYMVACYNFWAKWGPLEERTRLMAIVNCGSEFGNVLTFPLSGLLCRTSMGWPAVFYTFSAIGLVWVLLSLVLVYESPDVHPRITPEERDYIMSSIGTASSATKRQRASIPWRKMLTSVPLWSVTFALFTFNWVSTHTTATLPLFMHEVLKFDIKSNGVYSMLPFFASWTSIFVSGFISDFLTERRIMSVIRTRKVILALGHVTSALCLVLVSFLDCSHQGAAVALLTLSVGLTSVCLTTLPVNIYDVAPKYFSICYSFSNTLAVSPGFLTPMVVTALTKEKTREQWQVTFFITAALMVAGTLVFLVFGRGSPLPWAKLEDMVIEEQDPQKDRLSPEVEKENTAL